MSVIVYYLQNPALTPVVYDVDIPMEGLLMDNVANSKKDNTLIPFLDTTSDLYGYQTPTGQTIIPPQFYRAFAFNKYGIADVKTKELFGWVKIDKSGKVLATSYFFDNGPDYYVSGLSRFVQNNKIGFINKRGHPVVPAEYDWANSFSYNFPITVVAKGCKPVKFSEYEEVMKGGKWGAVDRHGKVIIPLIYDDFEYTNRSQGKEEKSILTFVRGDTRYQLFHTRWGKYKLIQVE